MAGPIRNLPIGQILVENGFINEKQLQEALDKQKQSGGKMLGDVMLEMGLVSETQLAQALSIRLKVPFVDLASVQINKDAVMKIPEATAPGKDGHRVRYAQQPPYGGFQRPYQLLHIRGAEGSDWHGDNPADIHQDPDRGGYRQVLLAADS